MPGFSLERNAFTTLDSLLLQFVNDLTHFGSTLTPAFNPFKIIKPAPGAVVLESDTDFLLGTSQPWRIAITIDHGMKVNLATPLQIDSTGYVAKSSWKAGLECGLLSTDDPADTKLVSYADWGISSLLDETTANITNWPLSYRLTVTDRGFIFFVWGEALTEDWKPTISWFCVQRPVNPDTGAPLVHGKCPLFCIYSRSGGKVSPTDPDVYPQDGIRQFVVREIDINVPRRPYSATYHTDMGNSIINPTVQKSFTEDKEYLVNFANGLTTSRFSYLEEFDLFCTTSADVIPTWTVADVPCYGESEPRKYIAMPANGPRESYMRLMILMDSPDIQYFNPPTASYIGTA